MSAEPVRVAWTDHALVKAAFLGLAHDDLKRAVLEGHARRSRNDGSADWRLSVASLVIVYNHPDRDDFLTARVVTVWRRR